MPFKYIPDREVSTSIINLDGKGKSFTVPKKTESYFRTAFHLGKAVTSQISKDHVFAYAGQASFFVIISAIPFLLLLISFLRLLIPEELPTVVDWLFQYAPSSAIPVLEQIFSQLLREDSANILSVSGIALLWASSRGIRSLSEGIRNVYGTRFSLPFWKKYLLSILTTLLLLLAIVISAGFLLFHDALIYAFGTEIGDLLDFLIGIRFLLLIAILAAIFSVLYYMLSGRSSPFRGHIGGALFSALAWNLFSWGYTLYVGIVSGPQNLYGSLSALVLLMIWVYFCMAILLLGAELNSRFFSLFPASSGNKKRY